MQRFVRSTLCRLCECPAGSDGVQLSRLDVLKLSRWWEKALVTDFEDEELENKFFCQFCLWDAKFQGEAALRSFDCDWWTGHDTNKLYKKYYSEDQLLKPCVVRLPALKLPQDSQSEFPGSRCVRTECVYCSATFQSRWSAYRHVLDSHDDVVKISCKSCFIFFSSEQEKKLHFEVLHPHTNVFCHVCKRLVTLSSLFNHISKNHFGPGQSSFECCGKIFVNQESLGHHFKIERMCAKRVCVYCNKSDVNLSRHLKVVHSRVVIKCHYSNCGKYFLSKDEKQCHLVEVHESKPGLVQCVFCECKISKFNMSRHVLSFHHSQAIRCTYNKCCTFFRSESERRKHELEWHFRTNLRRSFNCSQCGKSMFDRHRLKAHMRTFHQSEPIFCKICGCGEYFLNESELEKHFLLKHAADEAKKPFKCNECSYASRQKASLVTHVQTKHTRAGNFECGTCEKMFKREKSLRRHIAATHAERKKCIHCGEAQRYLHQHLLVAPCRKCEFVAPCRGLRKSHKKQCKKPITFPTNCIVSLNNE